MQPRSVALLIFALLLLTGRLSAAEIKFGPPPPPAALPPAQTEFFEKQIRPLLLDQCIRCHGPEKQKAGLRLDSREGLLSGGETGPAIIPGEPEKSRLISAVHQDDKDLSMPPKGKLTVDQITALTSWVKMGAPWPETIGDMRPPTLGPEYKITEKDRAYWAFQPVKEPPLPPIKVAAQAKSPIDRFVLAKLEEKNLHPAPPADKRTLLRRATFDLLGLPPTPEEIDAFLADDSPGAFAKVIDRLLASPHYGERWARHWLDVARYGEDQAHDFKPRKYADAFRYRDWVIKAFNTDIPYDRFIKMQLAGDLLGDTNPTSPAENEAKPPPISKIPPLLQRDFKEPPKQSRSPFQLNCLTDWLAASERADRIAATGYFALGPVYYGGAVDDEMDDRIDTLSRGFLGLTVACARCHDHKFDPIPTRDYYSLMGVFNSTNYKEYVLAPDNTIDDKEVSVPTDKQPDKNEKDKTKDPPRKPVLHALVEKSKSANARIRIRGNLATLGDEAPRRFLRILAGDNPPPFAKGSGRLELAEAIASPNNPLTARVMVNRLWQHHFGQGIVGTPSNFGTLGERPTHPELLDCLAAKFVAGGWSIKSMHREIMLSATYQESSQFDSQNARTDPDNHYLWRMNRRRLEVEPWRDAMLAVAGNLDAKIGGPPADLAAADNRRRTLYGSVSRHDLNPLLRLFDFPDPNITADKRADTIVPLQQLFVLNSDFMTRQAKALVAKISTGNSSDDTTKIQHAFRLVFGRAPSDKEIQIGLKFLSTGGSQKASAWEKYAQVLLSSNEFAFVD